MIRRLAHAAVVTGFVGTTVPDWLARRIDDGLGGVCWFAQNVADEAQATNLAAELHGLGAVLVMADEEGGDVTRLEAATGSSYPATQPWAPSTTWTRPAGSRPRWAGASETWASTWRWPRWSTSTPTPRTP